MLRTCEDCCAPVNGCPVRNLPSEPAAGNRAVDLPGGGSLWALRLLSLAALAAATYLSWISLAGGADSALGCGGLPQFDCEHVLSSRWAQWLGVPVSLAAVGVYGLMALGLFAMGRRRSRAARRMGAGLVVLCAALAAAAALWFLGLLAVATEKLCLWCMLIHMCGLICAGLVLPRALGTAAGSWPVGTAAARSLAGAGLAAAAVLVGGQVFFPSVGYRIDELVPAGPGQELSTRPSQGVSAGPQVLPPRGAGTIEQDPGSIAASGNTSALPRAAGQWGSSGGNRGLGQLVPSPPSRSGMRKVAIFGGQLWLDTQNWPVLGDPAAQYVVVDLSDYTCQHCRRLHGYLRQAREHYRGRLAVIFLPVPMNTECNQFVEFTHEDHQLSCDYARLALAVWRAQQGVFERFHDWLYEPERPPPLAEARKFAAELVGRAALEAQLNDPTLAEMIRQNTLVYHRAGRGTVPKLLFGRYVVSGPTHGPEELFELLESRLGIRAR